MVQAAFGSRMAGARAYQVENDLDSGMACFDPYPWRVQRGSGKSRP